ncbi:hypothetical protein DERF_006210 [Dermatophagoides farinae]|uniref:Uncharacterized protein n=1 Tax=Dermatophagoides farinae TaxID=6954 RepID=A0A922I7D0_DERFA|nr:hypothetical protein DERF_006210 [Dermatophagoides farinae]
MTTNVMLKQWTTPLATAVELLVDSFHLKSGSDGGTNARSRFSFCRRFVSSGLFSLRFRVCGGGNGVYSCFLFTIFGRLRLDRFLALYFGRKRSQFSLRSFGSLANSPFNVEPFGPSKRCLRRIKLSFFRTKSPILIISDAFSSSSIFIACSYGTERANNFIISFALIIMYGSHVFLVVATVILPSKRSNSAFIKYSANVFCTNGQHSFRYFSRYFGNNVANALSTRMPCGLSSG